MYNFRRVTQATSAEKLYSLVDMTENHTVIGIDEGQFVSYLFIFNFFSTECNFRI